MEVLHVAIYDHISPADLAALAAALGWQPDDVAGLLLDGGNGPLGFEDAFKLAWAAVQATRLLPGSELQRAAERARRVFYIHDEGVLPRATVEADPVERPSTPAGMKRAAIEYAAWVADSDPGLAEGALDSTSATTGARAVAAVLEPNEPPRGAVLRYERSRGAFD